ALKSIPAQYAQDRRIMPFMRLDGELHVAMVDPRDAKLIDEIARITKLRVTPHLAPASAIDRAQLLYKGDLREMLLRTAAAETATAPRSSSTDDASAVTMVNQLLEYACLTGASDIHIEPFEFETLVRLRIDGVLHEVISLAPAALSTIVARIKVLSAL